MLSIKSVGYLGSTFKGHAGHKDLSDIILFQCQIFWISQICYKYQWIAYRKLYIRFCMKLLEDVQFILESLQTSSSLFLSVVHDGLKMKRCLLELLIFGKTCQLCNNLYQSLPKANSHLLKAICASCYRVICFQRSSHFGKIVLLHLHRWYHETSDKVRIHKAHDVIFV